MKVASSLVKKLRITDIENLDPVTVIAEDFGPGSGKIIIECFGESWSHFWSCMGDEYTLETFFCKASDDYIAGKLCRGSTDEPDWGALPELIKKSVLTLRKDCELSKDDAREYYDNARYVTDEFSVHTYQELICATLGGDWMFRIPNKATREYTYLMRIIPVVKQAFHSQNQ